MLVLMMSLVAARIISDSMMRCGNCTTVTWLETTKSPYDFDIPLLLNPANSNPPDVRYGTLFGPLTMHNATVRIDVLVNRTAPLELGSPRRRQVCSCVR